MTTAFLYGCDSMWPDCYWRSERYVLLAIDAKSQMSLSFDMKNGTALGLVDATVFSIGADSKYIVVKQHPATDPWASSFDRSVTNYFIIERSQSPAFREREKGVRGPMKKEEFDKLAKSLSLPTFTKTFHDLE
jgi:hypothetical protein